MNRIQSLGRGTRPSRIGVWIQEGIFILACFAYLLYRIRPLVILEMQPTVFFKGSAFLFDSLKIPGGWTDWLCSWASLFWTSNLAGALFLSICLLLVLRLTRTWITGLPENRPINGETNTIVRSAKRILNNEKNTVAWSGHPILHTIHLIPASLILILMAMYDFHTGILMGLIINLAALLLFRRFAPKRQGLRAVCGLAAAVILYWITGGAFLTFSVLAGLEDLLLGNRTFNNDKNTITWSGNRTFNNDKATIAWSGNRTFNNEKATIAWSGNRTFSGWLLLLSSALLPYAAFSFVFLVRLKQAYWHNTTLENPGRFALAAFFLPGFYLLTFILAFPWKLRFAPKPLVKTKAIARILKLTAGTVLVCFGTWWLSETHIDETSRLALQLNRSMRESDWTGVLETARHFKTLNPLFSYHTNQALFQTDQLLDKMFSYPQNLGTLGLLMDYDWCAAWAEESGNFYWRLGLLSESMHWATEAYEHKGPTPDLLKRLGLIYMMKGANATAERFFLNLRNVPFHGKSADVLLRLNENPAELARNPAYKHVSACMPVTDFISLGVPSSIELEQLVKRNPANRMALEYLFAYYLLNGELKKTWDHVPDFSAAGYRQVPMHVQEALLLYAALTPKFDVNQLKKWVHPLVYKRFLEYERVLRGYGGIRADARHDLSAGFGESYWYYAMFVKSASKRSENQNDFR